MADKKTAAPAANDLTFIDEMLVNEGGGGTSVGYHGQMEVSLGWGFFASGVNAALEFDVFAPGDAASKDAAKAANQKKAAEHGKNTSKGFRLTIFREAVQVRTLKSDLGKVTLFFATKAYEAWINAFKTVPGLRPNTKIWAHAKSQPNPDGRMEKKQDGSDGPETFWIIDQVYPDQAACLAAAQAAAVGAEGGSSASSEPVPTGYKLADWLEWKPKILEECGNFAPPTVKKVSENYAVPVEFLMQFKPK